MIICLEAVAQRCSVRKGVLRNFAKFTGKHLCQSPQACNFILKKETLAQMFSCEFRKISKNTFSERTPPVAASASCTFNTLDCRIFRNSISNYHSQKILIDTNKAGISEVQYQNPQLMPQLRLQYLFCLFHHIQSEYKLSAKLNTPPSPPSCYLSL